jgi:predicted  nucleic acid-binding Zn-ribbon protein
MSNQLYEQLHDRYSRGEDLSAEEFSLLTQWYREQDAAEEQQINQNIRLSDAATQLQAQIRLAASQLQLVSQQIAETTSANEALRTEIAALQERLAQQISGRAA